jgi:hypothetical protein
MWVIGMVVCAGLMLVGHAFVASGPGAHAHDAAAVQKPVATATAPDGVPAAARPENAPQSEPVHRH